jgi:hypothetical protein
MGGNPGTPFLSSFSPARIDWKGEKEWLPKKNPDMFFGACEPESLPNDVSASCDCCVVAFQIISASALFKHRFSSYLRDHRNDDHHSHYFTLTALFCITLDACTKTRHEKPLTLASILCIP